MQRIQTITLPSQAVVVYGYDSANRLSVVTYPDGQVKTYHYEDTRFPNALTGITDENGNRYATWTYDAQGRAITSEHAGGADKVTLTYNTGNTVVTDARGTVRTKNLTTIHGVVKSTGSSQPGGSGCGPASSALTYDGNGNVASRTDFNGHLTTYTYDLSRNLETQRREGLNADGSVRPESRTISTAWHSVWRLPVKVAEPKKVTSWVYNGDIDPATGSVLTCAPAEATVPSIAGGTVPIGVLCQKTEQATTDESGATGLNPSVTGTPRVWRWTYNAVGHVLTADGPRTDVSDITTTTYYDAADPDLGKRGNVSSITNALGHVTQVTAYDLNGNPLTLIDPNGVPTTLTYDARQRLTARQVGSETTTYTYDGVGQLTRIAFPDGRVLTYTWDAAHRLTDITDALGNTVHYTLDAMGNRIKEEVKDPQGSLTGLRQREYDALNRLAKDLGAQGQSTIYEYDAAGNRTQVTDPLGHRTVSAFDALNRLIRLTDPGAGVTQLAYDGQDHLTQVTDPRSLQTIYTVDGLGNRTQQQSPDTGTTTSTFDAAGNAVTRTDAKGQTTTTVFDALNRPMQITHADGTQITTTWDTGSNGKGRLTRIDELTGSTVTASIQYAYDAHGRITQETRTQLAGRTALTHTTAYTWSAGQLTGLTLPSGRQLTYTRNGAGQITQIDLTDSAAGGSGQTKTVARQIAYHPFGGVKRWVDGAGQEHTRSQDLDGRTNGYTLGATPWLLSTDPAGRITGQLDGSNATNSATYGYDPVDRLTGATLPHASYGYSYDATGNRTSQSTGASTRTYSIDPASNRLTHLTNPSQSLTHDPVGSVTADGTAQYAYDARGRLVQALTAAGTVSYRINALGQRIRKTVVKDGVPVSDTLYHYDLAGHLIGESDGTGTATRDILWLDDTPLAVMQ